MVEASVVFETVSKQITALYHDDEPLQVDKKLKALEAALAAGTCKDKAGEVLKPTDEKVKNFLEGDVVSEHRQEMAEY